MGTGRLSAHFRPPKMAEDRVRFGLVNLDEFVNGQVTAFRGKQKVLALLVFHTSALPRRIEMDGLRRSPTFEDFGGQARFTSGGDNSCSGSWKAAVIDTHGDTTASGGRRDQRRVRIRLNMSGALSGSGRRSRSVLYHGVNGR